MMPGGYAADKLQDMLRGDTVCVAGRLLIQGAELLNRPALLCKSCRQLAGYLSGGSSQCTADQQPWFQIAMLGIMYMCFASMATYGHCYGSMVSRYCGIFTNMFDVPLHWTASP